MTSIEWTDETWNPTVGCSRVSPGCERCYAETVAHRGMTKSHKGLTVLGKFGPRWSGEVRMLPERLSKPLSWTKPKRVFVDSMSDLFHEQVTDAFIAEVFAVMAAARSTTFQVLTKRADRMYSLVSSPRFQDMVYEAGERLAAANGWCHANQDTPWPLPNVWLGVSAENQAWADERIPLLMECPAAVRFVSAEPLLGRIDFASVPGFNKAGSAGVDALRNFWVIVGGESGPGARPCDISWIYSIVEQCIRASVPVFVKQLGARPYDSTYQHGVYAPEDWRTPRGPDGLGGTMPIGNVLLLRDRKGVDMAEWPEPLRIRKFPLPRAA